MNNLKLDVADQIAILTISRPGALNALNSETLDELNTVLSEIEARDDVKVVILTDGPDKKENAFKSFVAGADIAEMVNFSAAEARAFGMRAAEPFFKLMKKKGPFEWTLEADRAFQDLKRYLTSPPVMVAPRPLEPLVLYLAATPYSASAALVAVREERQAKDALHQARAEVVQG